MTSFPEDRARKAVKRLATLFTAKFSERDKRRPFTFDELEKLYIGVFCPYIAVKFLWRLSLRGHEVEGVRTPDQLRGFGV